ncbi:C40 family peptidase [Nocardia sp. NPDC057440]|uniref:C40 family peptidase n=1 Tax=Nocardia sp. NPDC057440 TaxID=3346134 RepID=UPI003672A241
MAALPMIASALSGLAGGGQGANGGGDGGGETGDSGLSPESERALKVLELLAKVYGDDETTDPDVEALRKELGVTPGSGSAGGTGSGSTGKGETANAVRARQMFQRNAATAFNNVDNQLLRYITGLAGNNKVDKKAVLALVREVNVALAELGPQAYTKQGQQKVRQILTTALQKAHTIVSAGQSNSNDTANAINQLTNQYLYNISGQNYTPTAGGAGGASGAGTTAAAQRAIQVALAQTGKPYIYGDEGPNSFDCSGLMQYSAAAAGVRIPRVSEDQYRQLPQVNPANIQPGDLIFPADSFKSSGLPGHVIMYIGNGLCIAASKPGVPIGTVPLPSNYRATRWTA